MTILITGATSGFGKALAYKFAENNHDLIITGRRLERLIEIEKSMKEIEPHEQQRMLTVKERLLKGLEGVEIDSNRYEQEVIFYIEKLDINEEKVRLANHLKYFRETMKEENSGKKLGFIAQEMGREINTIGSKSNNHEIAHLVVSMKTELEKFREQVQNLE